MIDSVQFPDWSEAEYFASDRVSRSDLATVLQSCETYHGRATGSLPAVQSSAAMRFGTAVHLLVLEPAEAERRLIADRKFDRRRKGVKEEEQAWLASLPKDRLRFSPEDLDRAHACADAVKRHPLAARLLGEQARREIVGTWTEDGVECRARIDGVLEAGTTAFVSDLKTSSDPSPASFAKSAINYGYDLQAAFYPRPVFAAGNYDRVRFAFVVVRSTAPFEVAIYTPDDDFIALGERKVQRALELIRKARADDDWSSEWSRSINSLSAPYWALKEEGLL